MASEVAPLVAVFTQKDEGGAFVHPDEDVLAFLPVLFQALATSGADAEAPSVQRMVLAFAHRIGIPKDASADEVRARLDAFVAAHPVKPALLSHFQRALRELIAGRPSALDADKLAAALGERIDKRPLTERAPANGPRLGPMAALLDQTARRKR